MAASDYLPFQQLHRGPKTDDPAFGTALSFSPAAGLLAVGSRCATVSGHRRHAASAEVAQTNPNRVLSPGLSLRLSPRFSPRPRPKPT